MFLSLFSLDTLELDDLELEDFELERELLLELLRELDDDALEEDADEEEEELLEPPSLMRAIFFALPPRQVSRTLFPTEMLEHGIGALALFSHSTEPSREQVTPPTDIEELL